MGSSRGNQAQELAQAKTTADTQLNNFTENPLEKLRKDRTMKFLTQFDGGADVKDMEALSPYYNLYNNAKQSQTNQQVGRGAVALGGAPTSQLSDLDKYTQAQREENAQGMLYNAANEGYQGAVNESQSLINTEQSRASNKAGLAANMYQAQLARPRQAPLWERLLGMGIQGAGAVAGLRTAFAGAPSVG
jgi:hypothetical protein